MPYFSGCSPSIVPKILAATVAQRPRSPAADTEITGPIPGAAAASRRRENARGPLTLRFQCTIKEPQLSRASLVALHYGASRCPALKSYKNQQSFRVHVSFDSGQRLQTWIEIGPQVLSMKVAYLLLVLHSCSLKDHQWAKRFFLH